MENETIETVVTPESVETPITEQAVTTENAEPSAETVETKPEKTFTQAELDSIIQKRIERERESTTKKASQEARDAYIAEQDWSWNGKKITTEADYKQAKQEEQLWAQYNNRELPEDVIQELVEGKKFREKFAESENEKAERERVNADFQAFVETFPDAKNEDIPQAVWDEVNKGKSLVDAYTKYENQTLKQKLAEVEQAKQIEQQNQENAASSTGSLTGKAGEKPAFFTPDQVKAMSQTDVDKNWNAIMESQKKW
jgi:hypothetical protein